MGTKRVDGRQPRVEIDNLGRRVTFEDSRWHATEHGSTGVLSNRSAFSTPLTLSDDDDDSADETELKPVAAEDSRTRSLTVIEMEPLAGAPVS